MRTRPEQLRRDAGPGEQLRVSASRTPGSGAGHRNTRIAGASREFVTDRQPVRDLLTLFVLLANDGRLGLHAFRHRRGRVGVERLLHVDDRVRVGRAPNSSLITIGRCGLGRSSAVLRRGQRILEQRRLELDGSDRQYARARALGFDSAALLRLDELSPEDIWSRRRDDDPSVPGRRRSRAVPRGRRPGLSWRDLFLDVTRLFSSPSAPALVVVVGAGLGLLEKPVHVVVDLLLLQCERRCVRLMLSSLCDEGGGAILAG